MSATAPTTLPSNGGYVVELSGVVRHYGRVRAVDGVDLRVPRGSVFGLLGPNGAGKTTLIRLLLGLVRPRTGQIRLFGTATDGRPSMAAMRRIGALVETAAFYPYLSGADNLRVVARAAGLPATDNIDEALERVGLGGRENDRAGTYSLGMKQRLGLAAALLKQPELLVLDEPTNGLDPAGTREIRDLIRSLSGGGTTIILSSHLLAEVEQVCTDLAIMRRGRIVAEGTARDLLASHGAQIVALRVPADETPVAIERISAHPFVSGVTERDGWLEAEAPHQTSGALARVLFEAGLTVEEVVRRTPSLEAVFLDLTDAATDAGREPEPAGP